MMSFLKKPFQKLKEKHRQSGDFSDASVSKEANGNATGRKSTGDIPSNGVETPPDDRRQSREMLREQKNRRSMEKERNKIEAMKRAQLSRIESENFMRTGPQDLTKLYKPFSMNMSKSWNHENRVLFKDIDFASKSTPTNLPRHPSFMYLIDFC
jgi:hypothetical protein